MKKYYSFFILIFFTLTFSTVRAQLSGWSRKTTIQVTENTGKNYYNKQVLLILNSRDSIATGKFKADLSDLRFSSKCDGSTLLDYFIESGINTPKTFIWLKIDTLKANETKLVYFFYGNSTATPVTNFNNTFPGALVIAKDTVLVDSLLTASWIEIKSGFTASFIPAVRPGSLSIKAERILISGTLNANGSGYKGSVSGPGTGPGGGQVASNLFGGGGGGGYGGKGGAGAQGGSGGISYGTSSAMDIYPGSGAAPPGSLSTGSYGGDGGGKLFLDATEINIPGTILSEGLIGSSGGSYSAGGGGSGGGVLVKANYLTFTGSISVKGGPGGNPNVNAGNSYAGGGGGGGRIKLFYKDSLQKTGSLIYAGGAPGTGNTAGGYTQPVKGDSGSAFSGIHSQNYLLATVSGGFTFANWTYSGAGLITNFTDKTVASFKWNWDFGDGQTSNLKNPQHTYAAEGTYNVCLDVTSSCGQEKLCKPVIVTSPTSAFQYKTALEIQENSGKKLKDYQVLISMNTRDSILAGKMKADGSDIRFAKNCDGTGFLSYWIESGINTINTRIWLKIDSINANAKRTYYMLYGNPAAAAYSNFNNTFPNRLIISNSTAITDSVWNYDWVEIQSGAQVTLASNVPSSLQINARKIKINGIIDGSGTGYIGGVTGDGSGPGGGKKGSAIGSGAGGGAGYGGNGGMGANGGLGGSSYGTNSGYDFWAGSGGGPASWIGSGISGGNGGGKISLTCNSFEGNGSIKMNALAGTDGAYSGGGGSGGAILLKAKEISFSLPGLFSVKGGDGGLATHLAGGGGSGGRIKIFVEGNYSNTGTMDYSGGLPGSGCCTTPGAGSPGTFFKGIYVSGEPTYIFKPAYSAQTDFSYSVSGLNVTFTNLSSPSTAWTWEFGDGYTSNQQNPSHTFPANGAYNVCFTVSAPNCMQTRCKTINLNTPVQSYGQWKHRIPVQVKEVSGTPLSKYQVLMNLDALALINQGKMKDSSADLRFGNCDMSKSYSYWIESGFNTSNLKVWVKVDTVPKNDSVVLYMFYGNASALSQSSFDGTFPPSTRLDVTAGTTPVSGNNTYSWINVEAGASITLGPNSPTVLNARKIVIEGSINGDGAGYLGGAQGQNGSGAGGGQGQLSSPGGGGGGYGGVGGKGAPAGTSVANGGPVYGNTSTNSIEMGSGGGGSTSLAGGNGGGALTLIAEEIQVQGTVSMNGNNGLNNSGANGASGAGSGGGILLNCKNLAFTGSLLAKGGNGGGGFNPGGGGGGGRIKMFYSSLTGSGTTDVSKGTNGNPAPQAGTTYTNSSFVTYYPKVKFLPQLVLTTSASNNKSCKGSQVTFNAPAGYSNYTFLRNRSTAQSGASSTYTTSNLNDKDTIRVVCNFSNSCPDTSNSIIMNIISPEIADAGADQNICATGATLNAFQPVKGQGIWRKLTGNGIIADSTLYNTPLNNLSPGSNKYKWSVTYDVCQSSDTTEVFRYENPDPAYAGSNDTICTDLYRLNGNTPVIGNGQWSIVAGNASFKNINDPYDSVSIGYGNNTLRWTISNGVCPSSYADVSILRNREPDASIAGSDITICKDSSALAANIPVNGTGSWTVMSGTGILKDPMDASSPVSNLSYGNNVFEWTISNFRCPSSTSMVTIFRETPPDSAFTGPDQVICSDAATLSGNSPVTGSGKWTLSGGAGTIVNDTDPNSQVTGLATGTNIFEWSISNGSCPVKKSILKITRDQTPSASQAGSDQTICSDSIFLNARGPGIGTGKWSMLSGSGIFNNDNDPLTLVKNLSYGTNSLIWTISNGTCPNTTDTVIIFRDSMPSIAITGPQQTVCSFSSSLSATSPVSGSGQWSVLSGNGVINNISDPNSAVSGLAYGSNIFRWTVSRGTCPSSFADLTIIVDTSRSYAVAGPDQRFCNINNAVMNAQLSGSGQGEWSVISGSGIFNNTNDPQSTVSGLSGGTNIFQWKVINGICKADSSITRIIVDTPPGTASAGPDKTICGNSLGLSGNSPLAGTGEWSVISGSGNFSNINDPNTLAGGLFQGANTFRWTLQNGTCISSADVTITSETPPSTAVTGASDSLCTSTGMITGNFPTVGTGAWSLISGTGTILSPASPNSAVSNLSAGNNTFRWTISNGSCPPSYADITLTRLSQVVPGTANVSVNRICAGSPVNMNVSGYSAGAMLQWQDSSASGTWKNITGGNLDQHSENLFTTKAFRIKAANNNCPDAYSNSVKVQVDMKPFAGNISPDTLHLCKGNNTVVILSGSVGNIQWQCSSDRISIQDSTGANGTSVSVSPSGNRFYRARVSNGICPAAFSQWAEILTDKQSSAGNISGPSDICEGSAANLSLSSNVGQISWEESTDNMNYTGSGNNSLNITTYPSSSRYFRVSVKNGACQAVYSPVFYVDVHLKPRLDNFSANKTSLCQGQPVSLKASYKNGSISWWQSTDSISFSPAGIFDSTAQMIPGQNTWYKVDISNPYCINTLSRVISVKSLPVAQVDHSIPGTTICLGSAISLDSKGTNGNISWESSSDGIAWKLLTGQNNSVLSGQKPAQTIFYRAVSNNGSCADTSNTIKIQVIKTANAQIGLNKNQICKGDTCYLRALTPSGTLKWGISTDSTTYQTLLSSDSLLNDIPLTSVYYRLIADNGTCADTSVMKLKVDQLPVTGMLSFPLSVCKGEFALIKTTGNTGNITWQDSVSGGWNDILKDSLSLKLQMNNARFIRLRAENGVCKPSYGPVAAISVSANAEPGLLSAGNKACVGSTALATLSGHTGNLSWETSLDSTQGWKNLGMTTDTSITLKLYNTLFVRARVQANSCKEKFSNTIKINVVPSAFAGTITALADTICKGAETELSSGNSFGDIHWILSEDGSNWSAAQVSGNTFKTGSLGKDMYYRSIADNGTCMDTSSIQHIHVNNTPQKPVTRGIYSFCTGETGYLKATHDAEKLNWLFSTDNKKFSGISSRDSLLLQDQASGFYYAEAYNTGCERVSGDTIRVLVRPLPAKPVLMRKEDGLSLVSIGNAVGTLTWESAADGIHFKKIDQKGDQLILNGNELYYRLKSQLDGCSAYSDTIRAVIKPGVPAIYPVPANDSITLSGNLVLDAGAEIRIYDANGKRMQAYPITQDFSGMIRIDIREIPAGTYILRTEGNRIPVTAKFLKQ